MTPARVIAAVTWRRCLRSTGLWSAVMLLLVASSAYGYRSAYPDAASRALLSTSIGSNTGFAALVGVAHRLDTTGGFIAWRLGVISSTLLAVWALLVTTRSLRGEEEDGRWDLLLSSPVTARRATVAAALGLGAQLALLWTALVVGLLVVGAGAGLAVAGSLLFSTGVVGVAACFMALGMLASQLAPTRRGAAMICGGVLTVTFLLRLVADVDHSNGSLRTLSPMGWVENLGAFTSDRAVWLLPLAIWTVALTSLAIVLAGARDVGSGLLPARDSGPLTGRLLSGHGTQAIRVSRGVFASWFVGTAGGGFVFGLVAPGAAEAIRDSDIVKRLGAVFGTKPFTTATYVGFTFTAVMAILVSLAAGSHVTLLREEETSGRIESVLSAPVCRRSWWWARVGVATVEVLAIAAAAGVATWGGQAVESGGISLRSLVAAGIGLAPVGLLFLGIGVAADGLAPRATHGLVSGLVGLCFLLEIVGAALKAPGWVLDVSPMHHLSRAPSEPVRLLPLAVMLVLAAALAVAGAEAFHRRDLSRT